MPKTGYFCGDGITALANETYDYIFTSPPCYEDLAAFGVSLKHPESYRDKFLLPVFGQAKPKSGTITVAFTGARRHGGQILQKQWYLEHTMVLLGYYLRDIKQVLKSTSFNAYDHQVINVLTFKRKDIKGHYNLQRDGLYATYGHDVWGPFGKQSKVDGEVVGQPLQVARFCIENFTDSGEVVMDPFAGTATTCVAATSVGRKYLGYEIREKIWEVGMSRLRMFEMTNAY